MQLQRIVMGTMGLVASLAVSAAAAPPVAVSSCAAVIPAHRTGVLTGDVQCQRYCTDYPSIPCDPGCPLDPEDSCRAETIQLGRGARLRLDGHTISGAYNSTAIICADAKPGGTCTVTGPGEVQSIKGSAIASLAMNVRVRGLLMEGSYGAISTSGTVDVRRSVFGSWDSDVYGARAIRLTDSKSLGHGGGLYATETITLRSFETASYVRADGRIVGRGVTLIGDPGTGSCPPVDAPIVRITSLVGQDCTP